MNSGIFDDITRAFVAALEAGTLSLGAYLPAAPGRLRADRLVLEFWAGAGRGRGAARGCPGQCRPVRRQHRRGLLAARQPGPHGHGGLSNLPPVGPGGGGSPTSGLLLTPSAVVDLGFQIAEPLQAAATRMTGWTGLVEHATDHAAGHRRGGHRRGVPPRGGGPDGDADRVSPECHGGGRAHPVWHFWADRVSDGILYRLDHGLSPARAGHGRHRWGGLSAVQHRRGGHDGGGRPHAVQCDDCGVRESALRRARLVDSQ